MNEDEAFVRVIVDSPGDDTPRLVYTDWLDDRDDPRGPYLQAEFQWAKNPKKAEKGAKAAEAKIGELAKRSGLFPIGVPDQECTLYLEGVGKKYFGKVYVTAEPSDPWTGEE